MRGFGRRGALPRRRFTARRVIFGGGFGSHDMYALDQATGTLRWHLRTGDDGPTAAVVVDGIVLFNTESCTLMAADADTGALLWEKWLGDPLLGATRGRRRPSRDGVSPKRDALAGRVRCSLGPPAVGDRDEARCHHGAGDQRRARVPDHLRRRGDLRGRGHGTSVLDEDDERDVGAVRLRWPSVCGPTSRR